MIGKGHFGSAGSVATGVGAGIVILAGMAGIYTYFVGAPEPAVPAASVEETKLAQPSEARTAADETKPHVPAPETQTDAAPETQTDAAPEPKPAPDTQAKPVVPPVALPRFGDVRLEADGQAVIAGSGPAGFALRLEEDGTVLGTTQVNGSGDFAMLLELPPSAEARVLYLVAVDEDGTEHRSEESIVLTPPAPPPSEPLVASLPEETPDETDISDAPVVAETEPSAQPDIPADPAEEEPTAAEDSPEIASLEPEEDEPEAPADNAEVLAQAPERPVEEVADEPTLKTDRPAEVTPTVLLAGRDGVELLQPAAAPRERLENRVVVDVISYAGDGSVSLSGRAAASPSQDDRVRVYLDNKPVETSQVGSDGNWRMGLPSVRPGVYTLRVDQLDESGQVVARFETPFKREDPSELARIGPHDATPGEVSAALITVQPGYTLWGIASERYGDGYDYIQIFEANRSQIRDPDLIYPGQVFELPDGDADSAN
ncbi:LysM peptidoglycan-binding domain-containing protein [Tropicimonas sp. TH_r6]|uniref:LysM peptidoglycan-binding domain-containing protein n=1 Tax=Tropicimonas sp. TH_r6 TaxID=3082085 RepID=UPI002953609E|nr:LysM peptidoglycan-binding domain-containing protein [Tropicimonas sp. TH_r6]MDV7145016.1 LysM peptidoglycan-binding domain-containing protein [Tropicimonas sp. TH_r6]